ncbi:DEK domain-containing chromatin-associated protein 2-like [Henckelia pumila]|uniref:DEK domain-containing chromatin-associated protein 2-like n=1 Tax=Henckelia pumila TaxID=405737 RepID=UPI003C6E0DB6
MGEESVLSEESEPVTNGKAEGKADVAETTEDMAEKREEQSGGVEQMEEDKGGDGNVESLELHVDKEEVDESKGIKENEAKGSKQEGTKGAEGQENQDTVPEEAKEDDKSQKKAGDTEDITKRENEDKVDEEDDGMKGVEEKPEEPKEEKSWKKRPRSKSSAGKQDKSKKKKSEEHTEKESRTPTDNKIKEPKTMVETKEEMKTPATPMIERPVRERKSVERLVASIDKDSAKEFHVEKGRGTALKDIPKVAYKLSRKKNEDTFKLLHTILFGRRGKTAQVKNNISRFSGFVWRGNEEKQLTKVREKLEKFVKEKLVELCDVLDLPNSNPKKEDIISNLIKFLEAPCATSTRLLAEKEQSSKGKKRKRTSKSASDSDTPAKGSVKNQKKIEGASKKKREAKSSQPGSEEGEEAHEEEGINSVAEISDVKMSEQTETEKKESDLEKESDKDKGKKKPARAKSSVQKRSAEIAKKEVTISKKASSPSRKTLAKSPQSRPNTYNRKSAKKSSGKKKDESDTKLSSLKKSALQESIGKKVLKVKVDKPAEEKSNIEDDDIRNAICEILTEVDFNKATFNDILKTLAKRFNMDMTSRKSSIKTILQAELTKLIDAGDAEDRHEIDNDKKKPSSQDVKA